MVVAKVGCCGKVLRLQLPMTAHELLGTSWGCGRRVGSGGRVGLILGRPELRRLNTLRIHCVKRASKKG